MQNASWLSSYSKALVHKYHWIGDQNFLLEIHPCSVHRRGVKAVARGAQEDLRHIISNARHIRPDAECLKYSGLGGQMKSIEVG